MFSRFCAISLALFISAAVIPLTAFAGFDEGLTAAQKGDFATALREWRPLAQQGNARAQYNLGVMYDNGKGVPQDYKETVKWFRLAADQGNAGAQSNLGLMYENGQGVEQSRVVAFALYNLSAANGPSAEKTATANRTGLAEKMSNKEIEAAQDLTRELAKPKNLLVALDKYIKKPTVKESVRPVAALDEPDEPIARAPSDGFPARPAKQPGVVSCNTRCENAACWRTYDSGKKVRFQAKQVFDPFTSQFKFDSGNC